MYVGLNIIKKYLVATVELHSVWMQLQLVTMQTQHSYDHGDFNDIL